MKAACYLSDYNDARNYIDRAKKIENSRDVQILELLFNIKVGARQKMSLSGE